MVFLIENTPWKRESRFLEDVPMSVVFLKLRGKNHEAVLEIRIF